MVLEESRMDSPNLVAALGPPHCARGNGVDNFKESLNGEAGCEPQLGACSVAGSRFGPGLPGARRPAGPSNSMDALWSLPWLLAAAQKSSTPS